MASSITPFLMFDGQAEAAIDLYMAVFPDAQLDSIERYGPQDEGPDGGVRGAAFTLCGQQFRCFDSPIAHEFTFTPSLSMFVEFDSAAELDAAFAALSDGGRVLMPLDNYGFSHRFGWADDRFGVSWQLNLKLRDACGDHGCARGGGVILEVATLDVIPGKEAEFEESFSQARHIIAGMSGYREHELQRCLEQPSRYVLLVRWEKLEDHTQGFRQSPEYQEWKSLLHHYYEPFPTVEHYSKVF